MPVYRFSKSSHHSKSSSSDKTVSTVQDDLRCIRGAIASQPEPSAVRHRSPARNTLLRTHLYREERPYRPVAASRREVASPLSETVQTYGVPDHSPEAPAPSYMYEHAPMVMPVQTSNQRYVASSRNEPLFSARSVDMPEDIECNPFWVQRVQQSAGHQQTAASIVRRQPYTFHPAYFSSPLRPNTHLSSESYTDFRFSSPPGLAQSLPSSPNLFASAPSLPFENQAPIRPLFMDARPFTPYSTRSALISPRREEDLFPAYRPVQVLADPPRPQSIHYLNESYGQEGQEWDEQSVSSCSRDYNSQGENVFTFTAAPMVGRRSWDAEELHRKCTYLHGSIFILRNLWLSLPTLLLFLTFDHSS